MKRYLSLVVKVDAACFDDEALKPEVERCISDVMLGTCFAGKRAQRALPHNGFVAAELIEFSQTTED